MKTDKRNSFIEWVEMLQQESWQLELLISGFALYGIWASQDMLQIIQDYININKPSGSVGAKVVALLTVMLRAGWLIFFINLLIHVVLRGLWIGAIGLRYVSGNIDYDELNYSEYFTKYFKKKIGSFDDYIEKLEKICSVIFAYTFLLFFIFLSFTFFIIFNLLLGNTVEYFFGNDSMAIGTSMVTFWFFALIAFVDFITLGAFKKVRNEGFSKYYSYIYKFFSFITLSFIYRPLLYNFIDYKYTRGLFWFSIPYIFILTMVAPKFVLEANPYFPDLKTKHNQFNKTSEYILDWNNYDDLREEHIAISGEHRRSISLISLSNYRIKDSYGALFLRQIGSDEKLLSKKYKLTPYRKSGLRNRLLSINEKDSLILEYKKQKIIELKKLVKEKRKLKKEKDLEGIKRINLKIDSIRLDEIKKVEKVKEDKILSLRNALMEINKISIDGKPFNKNLSCKFYINPNLNEKGLLCDFSVDSLSKGEHLLTLRRTVYNKIKKDSTNILTLNLPFWVLKN